PENTILRIKTLRPLLSQAEIYSQNLLDISEEQKRVEEKTARREQIDRNRIRLLVWSGVAGDLLIAVLLLLAFNRNIATRLQTILENTQLFAKREKLKEALPGDDEISALDAAFHQMSDAVREAEEMRKQIFQMVAHDLRSPLMSMRISLNLLSSGASGDLPDEAFKQAAIAESTASKLVFLINDLLDVEKLESGNIELEKREMYADVLGQTAIDTMMRLANSRKIQLELKAADCVVYCDERRIGQVLLNLLSNAIKFAPEDSIVTLKIQEQSDGEGSIFTVIDRGAGLSEDDIQKLFMKFGQASTASKIKDKGTGLGLYICKWIVESHGGSIGVECKDAETRFSFALPAKS
ncbi:MAG: HAMP domain-containing histidine kinase, partial [Candidatus Obscuribacterales bacterium]|nr:HAMP domain-containing histidine kinase [Candidatus Obscuribacterales bacterium]